MSTLSNQRTAAYQAALRAYGKLRAAKLRGAPDAEIERLTADAQHAEAQWRATQARSAS